MIDFDRSCKTCHGLGTVKMHRPLKLEPRPLPIGRDVMAELHVNTWFDAPCPDCSGRVEIIDDPILAKRGEIAIRVGRDRYHSIEINKVRQAGLKKFCGAIFGIDIGDARVPVIQHGRTVGTLPDVWHPALAVSTSFLYEPRPGDFVRAGAVWIAHPTLGPGDLDAITDFQRSV